MQWLIFIALSGGVLITVIRYVEKRDWQRRWQCSCGYHEKFESAICPRCGNDDRKRTAIIARATPLWGWEIKEKKHEEG